MIRWLLFLLAVPLLAQECTYTVTPGSLSVPATGGIELSPRFTVASRLGCAWTARSNVSWITVAFGQSGNGNGTIGVTIDVNRDAVTRSGSLTIAGQTISVLQAAANCAFSLNPESAPASPAGGNGTFQVNTTCNWQAVTNVDWIDVTAGASGTGSGTVTYVVRANAGASRSGTIQVGPLRFTVQQSAGTCTQSLNPPQVSLPAAGGNGVVQVTSSCSWTAASSVPWITITSGAGGAGDGTLAYLVQANTGAQRSGTIRIGNQTFTVNQAGTSCSVAITPASANVLASGGNGTIVVSTTCASWIAVANDAWITITPNAATVSWVAAANSGGSPRTGSISIGNQTFTITQPAGACAVTLSPGSVQIAATGGSGNFLVSSQPGCHWTIASPPDWITLSIGSGDGSGTVIYTVTANQGSPRTAAITVNGQSFTISQSGVLPSFTSAGVLNAASFAGGGVAPGLILTIFGTGLGPSTLAVPTIDPVARVFPTELAGTRVLFDDVAAPLLYVSATQVSVATPFGVAGRQTSRMEVEVGGVRSQAVFVAVSDVAPGIFTQSAQGSGPGAILNEDFTVNGPDNPAAPGSYVFLFATGGGVVEPATADGRLSDGASNTTTKITAEIDGQPADVIYAGGAPHLVAGVLQVNVRLPANLGPGERPVVLRAGDAASQARVTVSVR